MSKLICSSSALLRCLKQVAHVIKRNPVVPILDCALFTLKGGELTLTGYDLETSIVVRLPVENVDRTDWLFCVEAKPLLEVLANLPDQPIVFTTGTKPLQIRLAASVHTNEQEATGGASYIFADNDAANYPLITEVRSPATAILPGHLLRTAFAYTVPLVSNDELRPAMMCMRLQLLASQLRFTATDGHRLGLYEVQASQEPGYSLLGAPATPLLLGKTITVLAKLLKNDELVKLSLDNQAAKFQLGEYGPVVTIRLVDERYPDADSIIPVAFGAGTLTLNRTAAQAMMRRLRPFVSAYIHNLTFKLSGTSGYALAADKDTDSEAQESLPGTFAAEQDLTIAFNLSLLAPLLALLPGPRVRFQFAGAGKACIVTADGFEGLRYLIMPLQTHDFN